MTRLFPQLAVSTFLLSPLLCGADAKVDFAKEVQPIFAESCVQCHGAGDPKDPKKGPAGGLRLDDRASFLKGGKSGKAVVPRKAKDSLLFKLLQGPAKVRGREIPAMPRAAEGEEFQPLEAEKIATVQKWIDQGAKWEEKRYDFAADVQPILAEACGRCHGPPNQQGNGGGRGPGGPGGGPGGRGGGPGPGGFGGGPRGPAGGLRVDDKALLLKGGKSGKAVVPGKSSDSLLVKVLAGPVKLGGKEVPAMPKAMGRGEFTPLPADKVDVIKKWIDQGAR